MKANAKSSPLVSPGTRCTGSSLDPYTPLHDWCIAAAAAEALARVRARGTSRFQLLHRRVAGNQSLRLVDVTAMHVMYAAVGQGGDASDALPGDICHAHFISE